MAPRTLPLMEALGRSVSSGRFADTKIILYSRRDASGAISRPKALYASSHVLRSVPYFNDLLSGEFAESEPKDFSEPVDEGERAENYGYHPDSDLEDDEDAVNAAARPSKKAAIRPRSNSLHPIRSTANHKKPKPISHGEWKEPSVKGTVIKIRDIAFITFQAFLLYLYTGDIEFAPYGSEENRRSRSVEIISSSEDSIPRPSPKSIYRLADKYEIPSLKQLALNDIKGGLKECDTVEEVFSEFSSSYEEVRTAHVTYLASLLSRPKEGSAGDICDKLDEMIDRYVNGDLDHAVDAVTLLWKCSKGSVSAAPVPQTQKRKPASSLESPDFEVSPGFLIALIKSMRSGMLSDRKYWVRASTTTKVLRPIYISSVVAGERSRHINSLVKLHRRDEPVDMGDSESEDSDRENETMQASEPTPEEKANEKEEVEQASLPVLTIGSFASWKFLFFYLCTNTIQFAPLESQDANTRTQRSRDQTTPEKGHSVCSPKAIYSLATALGIETLQDLALNDIRSKITSANVVTELFSNFTSRQPKIRRMQCDLLYDKFNNEATTTEGVALIESIPGGSSAHCAGALKLALKEGFISGVSLRCSRTDCKFRNSAIPYRSLESDLRCPQNHGYNVHLDCAGCGTSRPDGGTSCKGCGRRFKQNTITT